MVAASAVFVKLDTATSGNWPGVYGSQGYFLFGGSNSAPSYSQVPSCAQVSFNSWNSDTVWAASTTDPRALPISAASGAARYAGCWWTWSTITINVNVTDGGTHRLALYALDWNKYGWNGTYEIHDHVSQQVLSSQTLSNYGNGVYAIWAITGNVDVVVNHIVGSPNPPGLSGLFLDPSGTVPTTVTLTSSVNPAVVGQQVTFTATVVPVTGAVAPTGTVTFYDGTTVIGTGTLS